MEMSSQAPAASELALQRQSVDRAVQSLPPSALPARTLFAHPPEFSKGFSQQQVSASDMLLSPLPAGQKLPNSQALGGTAILHPPIETADSPQPWEVASSKEEGKKKRQPCSFFLKTGNCAFGSECKFEHPLDQPATQYNSLGLPLRPGEPDCAYYVKNLHCGYGGSCKFHHAEPVIGWMPIMNDGMGMHPSLLGYGQLPGLPTAGLPGTYPVHMPMMHQGPPQMPVPTQMSNLPSSQQYAQQVRPFMPLTVPMLMPHQQYMQMPMPGSSQLLPQAQPPQHTPASPAGPLLYHSLAQRVLRPDMRTPDVPQALTSDPTVSSRPAEAGRSRRRGRGRGGSFPGPTSLQQLSNERTLGLARASQDPVLGRPSSKDPDSITSAFSSMSLDGQREGQ